MSGFTKGLLADILHWGQGGHPQIFVSYRRRGEGAGYAGRLADKLVEHFGSKKCFRDVDDIESGIDFAKAINEAVGACEVLIAVIGPDWITQTDKEGRRRLDNPQDFVRLEIAAALDRNIRVIPVLVGEARMPKAEELPKVLEGLAGRQAHELSDTRWEYDIGKLVSAIESIGIRGRSGPKRGVSGWNLKRVAWISGGALGFLLLVGLLSEELAPTMDTAVTPPVTEQVIVNPVVTDSVTPSPSQDVSPPAVESKRPAVTEPVTRLPTPVAPPPERPNYESDVIAAVQRGNEAEIQAQSTLDPQYLYGIFAEDALEMELTSLQYFISSGEVSVNTLLRQEFGSVRVSPDGSEAEVEVEETWSSEHRSGFTGQCLHRIPSNTVPQTVYLWNESGRWVIYDIETDFLATPDAVPCDWSDLGR
jgi:hypothetical protein